MKREAEEIAKSGERELRSKRRPTESKNSVTGAAAQEATFHAKIRQTRRATLKEKFGKETRTARCRNTKGESQRTADFAEPTGRK